MISYCNPRRERTQWVGSGVIGFQKIQYFAIWLKSEFPEDTMLYLGLYDNNYVGSGLSLKLMFITSLFVQTCITSLPNQWYSRATTVYTLMTLQTNTNVSQIHWLNDEPHFPLSISRKFVLKKHILLILHWSGQIIILHQPRYPWNKGISLPQLPFGVRLCEVAIIWRDWFKRKTWWNAIEIPSHRVRIILRGELEILHRCLWRLRVDHQFCWMETPWPL